MKRKIFLLAILVLLSATSANADNRLRESVVKVFVTANRMDHFRPWQSEGSDPSSGSGCIIAGNRILTNAHVVDSATFIQVRKESDPRKYTAKVEALGNDSDLALLSVNDPEFFKGTVPAELAPLPYLQDSVIVVGFPEGGDKVSITEGVVSRIEIVSYSQSGKKLLGVQIDAAINPGNSGGPVYQGDKVVGVAMQIINNSQNIGYIIPAPVVEHFLNDLKDGRYDGTPLLGIDSRNSENKALREFYKLSGEKSGVLTTWVHHYTPAENILRPGDTIMEIDDVPIAVDGTYEFRGNERLTFSYLISRKQIGDDIKLKFVRDGNTVTQKIKLSAYRQLVPPPSYFKKPPYYIYGGLVFSVLSADLLKSWGPGWWEKAPVPFLNYIVGTGSLNEKRKKDVVVLLDVLPDDITNGYTDINFAVMAKLNGIDINSFEQFVRLAEKSSLDFNVFETDDATPIIVPTKNISTVTDEIMKRNNIPARYSEDVADLLRRTEDGEKE